MIQCSLNVFTCWSEAFACGRHILIPVVSASRCACVRACHKTSSALPQQRKPAIRAAAWHWANRQETHLKINTVVFCPRKLNSFDPRRRPQSLFFFLLPPFGITRTCVCMCFLCTSYGGITDIHFCRVVTPITAVSSSLLRAQRRRLMLAAVRLKKKKRLSPGWKLFCSVVLATEGK